MSTASRPPPDRAKRRLRSPDPIHCFVGRLGPVRAMSPEDRVKRRLRLPDPICCFFGRLGPKRGTSPEDRSPSDLLRTRLRPAYPSPCASTESLAPRTPRCPKSRLALSDRDCGCLVPARSVARALGGREATSRRVPRPSDRLGAHSRVCESWPHGPIRAVSSNGPVPSRASTCRSDAKRPAPKGVGGLLVILIILAQPRIKGQIMLAGASNRPLNLLLSAIKAFKI